MFVDLVVPQNIFFDAKSGKKEYPETFLEEVSPSKNSPKKKMGKIINLEIIYNFVKKYMKM